MPKKRPMATKKRPAKKKKAARKPPLEVVLMASCDGVSRDPNVGKVSLYGLFDVIWNETFPLAFRPFTLFVQFAGNGDYPIAIELRKPDGTSDTIVKANITCQPEKYAVLEVGIAGLEFKKPGKYWLAITTRGRDVGRPKELYLKRKPKKKAAK